MKFTQLPKLTTIAKHFPNDVVVTHVGVIFLVQHTKIRVEGMFVRDIWLVYVIVASPQKIIIIIASQEKLPSFVA